MPLHVRRRRTREAYARAITPTPAPPAPAHIRLPATLTAGDTATVVCGWRYQDGGICGSSDPKTHQLPGDHPYTPARVEVLP